MITPQQINALSDTKAIKELGGGGGGSGGGGGGGGRRDVSMAEIKGLSDKQAMKQGI